MARPKKMTAEQGLEILESRGTLTEAGMTRLQKQMSVKQASRFRRLIRERSKLWRQMSERCLTKSMREKGAKARANALGTGRSRYTMLDATMCIPLDDKRRIFPTLHRYPNGKVYVDIRIWAGKMKAEDTEIVTPTRKGVAVPFEKLPYLIAGLKTLERYWIPRLCGAQKRVKIPPKLRKIRREVKRFLERMES